MTPYESFLRHRRRMERAAGREVVRLIESGAFHMLRKDNPYGLVYGNGTFKGTDRDVTTLIEISGAARSRRRAASRAWQAQA